MITSKRRTRIRALAGIAIGTILGAAAAARAEGQCRPHRVAIIGDSVTLGRSDPGGGFATRAGLILQASPDTFTTVLNRGLGGATTGTWLAPPSAATWHKLAQLHADLVGKPPPGMSMAEAVASLDRPLDAIVILLGVNDRVFHNRSAPQVAANLHSLQERLRPFADTVLVSTLTPGTGAIAEAAITGMNEVIRAEFPDLIPLGDWFRGLPNWAALLEDSVHPTANGHAALASITASQLVERRLVGAVSRPPIENCKCYAAEERKAAPAQADSAAARAVERPSVLCVPAPKASEP